MSWEYLNEQNLETDIAAPSKRALPASRQLPSLAEHNMHWGKRR